MNAFWDNLDLCEENDNELEALEDNCEDIWSISVTGHANSNARASLVKAIYEGDLSQLIEIITLTNWDVNENISESFQQAQSLLHIACEENYYDIVQYLVIDCSAEVNNKMNSKTPLMAACSSVHKEEDSLLKICQLLVEYGASTNVEDSNGMTPFKLACQKGHISIARWLIVRLEISTTKNENYNELYNAACKDRPESVRTLVLNDSSNSNGYITQKNEAKKILDVNYVQLSQDFFANIPTNYLIYNNLEDFMPRLFSSRKCPEYFQDIYGLLLTMTLEKYTENFANAQINLEQFLCLGEEELRKLGFKYDCHRQLFQKCLIDFHLHHWQLKPIGHLDESGHDFGCFLIMIGSHTRNLILMKASLHYIQKNLKHNRFGSIDKERIIQIQNHLKDYRDSLHSVRKLCEHMISFRPKRYPLYIDYKPFSGEKRSKSFKPYLTLIAVFIGVSAFLSMKLKRILHI